MPSQLPASRKASSADSTMTFQQITNVSPGSVLPASSSSRSESPYLRSASSSAWNRGEPTASTASACSRTVVVGGFNIADRLLKPLPEPIYECDVNHRLHAPPRIGSLEIPVGALLLDEEIARLHVDDRSLNSATR